MATLIELAERRGRLRERIAAQRALLARDLAPMARALSFTGRLTDQTHRALAWLRARPVLTGALLAGVVLLRPRRTWRLTRWALLGWRLWKILGRRPQA